MVLTASEVFGRVRVLRGRVLQVDELAGGLTNRTFRVRTDDGGDYVVRFPRSAATNPVGVDRAYELANTELAGDAGVGAPFVEAVPDLGALVVGFVPGRTLGPADLADSAVISRVSSQLRALHRGPQFRGGFDLAAYRRRYVRLAEARGVRLPAGYVDLDQRVAALEAALRSAPEPRVPCHNDLVAANLLDDGVRAWLVDFEYSAMNVATFDLGNLVACSHLPPEPAGAMVSAYFTRTSRRDHARVQAWALLSAYTWTAWAATQDEAPDAWQARQLDAARAGLLGPRYRTTLADVAAGG
ncbi:MAG TPA: phosphotransferase [Actinomycetes bacterium]|nr:phosphotransferase [Actinomycetes bacterium]